MKVHDCQLHLSLQCCLSAVQLLPMLGDLAEGVSGKVQRHAATKHKSQTGA